MKDYNANTTTGGADSEDEEDPRTPTSVSSQGSQGYDSGGSDFVDIEGFTSIPDSSLPELQLQVNRMKNNRIPKKYYINDLDDFKLLSFTKRYFFIFRHLVEFLTILLMIVYSTHHKLEAITLIPPVIITPNNTNNFKM